MGIKAATSQPSSIAGNTAPNPPAPTPPPGTRLFQNTRANDLTEELNKAQRLGVKPIRGTGSEFEQAINEGTIKWAVTQDGDLLVMPKYVQGQELAHTVLTNGQPVLAAGEAEIAGTEGQYVGIEINNHTGHYFSIHIRRLPNR